MSPKISYFTEGMIQAGRDVALALAMQAPYEPATGFPVSELTTPERREWLRGYAAGILQALSDTRPRGNPAPVTGKEGTAH
jgi:hypothetical protein